MKRRNVFAVLVLFACGCGGASVQPNPEPVSVTVNLTQAGKPLTDVNFNFQPTGAGLPAVVPVVKGTFQAQVTPGTYTWYITPGKSPQAFAAIPAGFREGAMDRQLEIAAGAAPLDLKIE